VSAGLRVYLDFVVFAFGAVAGSFLNVCIHRMPRDQSIVRPPSHCPHCNQPIRWFHNIPLVSYVMLRGRCRNCGARITPRYVLVESLTAVLFLMVWVRVGLWLAPIYWVLVAGLIVATFIDFEHYIIPNEITYGGILVGLALSALYPPLQPAHFLTRWLLSLTHLNPPAWTTALLKSFLGVITGGLTLLMVAIFGEKIFKKEAMGMGDVKFLAAIGAFLGLEATLFALFVSSVAGGVTGLSLILARRKDWQSRIPYGPYIAFGAVVWIFWGPAIVDWYWRFINRG
jgi:leader peptidase (prepilin peptidase) / N-methyltransferase